MFDSSLDTERAFGQHRGVERTYVRRRWVVAVVVTAVLAVALCPLAAGAARRGEAPVAPAGRAEARVVVGPGDTLWSIARRERPADDPREVVDAIEDRNAVDAGALVPGQSLVVPLG
jgi:LysM domain